jgi:ribonuclease-3
MPASDSEVKPDAKDQKVFNQAPKESGSGSSEPKDQKIFNPWNPRNKIIDDATLHAILAKYGVTEPLPHPELFRQACVHKSYVDRREEWASEASAHRASEASASALQRSSEAASAAHAQATEEPLLAERPPNCLPLQEADNEESEFAGDSLLGCVVALYLYERYAGKGEGFLTRLRTRIVNNKMLGELAKKLGLEPWIIVSRHVEDVCVGGRGNLRLLGSMLEAWIYALFKNYETPQNPGRGFQIVRTFLVNVIQRHVNFVELITDDTNFKDQLLRHFQATYHQPPRYREVSVVGPPHDRVFTMGVIDPANETKIIARATARNKKVAEQEASRLALAALCPE